MSAKRLSIALVAAALSVSVAHTTHAAVLAKIDFNGLAGMAETNTPGYTNANNSISSTPVSITDYVSGTASGATFAVTKRFQGLTPVNGNPTVSDGNPNGTNAPTGDAAALFASTDTIDSFYGVGGNAWNGVTSPDPQLTFAGLNPAKSYTFTIFASRMGVGDVRTGNYVFTGANSGSGVLNASNNTGNVLIIPNINPTAAGNIVLDMSKAATNNNANGFFYLTSMQIEVAVPEPVSLSTLGAASTLLLRRRRAKLDA